MWIVCKADNSHEMSGLISYENYKQLIKMSSAAVDEHFVG